MCKLPDVLSYTVQLTGIFFIHHLDTVISELPNHTVVHMKNVLNVATAAAEVQQPQRSNHCLQCYETKPQTSVARVE